MWVVSTLNDKILHIDDTQAGCWRYINREYPTPSTTQKNVLPLPMQVKHVTAVEKTDPYSGRVRLLPVEWVL